MGNPTNAKMSIYDCIYDFILISDQVLLVYVVFNEVIVLYFKSIWRFGIFTCNYFDVIRVFSGGSC